MRAAIALSIVIALAALPAAAEAPTVAALPVPLDPALPGLHGVGKLTYRGGLALESEDPRFGGWSDLLVEEAGARLVAIGDQGSWMTAALSWDARGDLVGFTLLQLDALRDESGQPVTGKAWSDAEGLAPAAEGGYLVAFEREHRLWRYSPDFAAAAIAAKMPTAVLGLNSALANHGMEALARLADGSLLIILEGGEGGGGTLVFQERAAGWRTIPYLRLDGFQVTGAAPLINGALLVLERFYSPQSGPQARLRFFPGADLQQPLLRDGHLLAELAPPLTVDNFEGVAAFTSPAGALMVMLLADDNFNRPAQRTLLLAFELVLD